MLRSVCVFCGSKPGLRPEFLAAAAQTGREIARRGITLVYGGASVGLMGALADAALGAGGRVVGVIPDILRKKELAHPGLQVQHIVKSLAERKELMAELSDAFIVLPGGLGTMDELFEMLTWGAMGLGRKPVGALDLDGFYRPLIGLLDGMAQTGFVAPGSLDVFFRPTPESLLDELAAWAGRG